MSPIRKLYRRELRRIKKCGAFVCESPRMFDIAQEEFGHECIGFFLPPDRIYISDEKMAISYRLCILLHEEGHLLDKEDGSRFLREYRAQRYLVEKALKFNNKLVTRHVIRNTIKWLDHKKKDATRCYYHAARKLMKTKLWGQLCQN